MKSFYLLVFITFLFFNKSFSQWTSHGPYGGVILCSEQVGNDIFIGTISGIYKSTDGGNTYSFLNSNLPLTLVDQLFFDGTTMYAGIDQKGVYISSDTGKTWVISQTGMGIPYQFDYPFLKINNKVFSYNVLGTFYTTNHGLTWTALTMPVNMSGYFLPLFKAGNILFKQALNSSLHSLYRSTDEGANWDIADSGMTDNITLHIYPIAATLYAFNNKKVYTSTDGGMIWHAMTNNKFTMPSTYDFQPATLCYNGQKFFGCPGGNSSSYMCSIAPGDTQWTIANNNFSITGYTFCMFTYGSKVFACKEATLYNTVNNGALWSILNNTGIMAIQIKSVFAAGNKVFAGEDAVIYNSNDAGQTWNISGTKFQNYVRCFESFNNIIFAGTEGYGIYKTTDFGVNWSNPVLSSSYIYTITNDGTNMYAGGGGGGGATVYKSINSGAAWTVFSSGLPNGAVADLMVLGSNVYAATGANTATELGIYKTASTAAAWVNKKTGLPLAAPVSLAHIGNIIYTGTEGLGVYKSSDFAANWIPEYTGIEKRNVRDLLAVGNDLYAATDSGVYVLKSGNTTWQNISANLPIQDMNQLSSNTNYLYASTNGASIWQMQIGPIGIHEFKKPEQAITVFPNPATEKITISGFEFSVGDKIHIIDFSGRKVEEQIVINPSNIEILTTQNLKEGIYLLKIITDENIPAQKLIIK